MSLPNLFDARTGSKSQFCAVAEHGRFPSVSSIYLIRKALDIVACSIPEALFVLNSPPKFHRAWYWFDMFDSVNRGSC